MIDEKKKEKILEIHSFLTNKGMNTSLNFINFIKKINKSKNHYNIILYFNLILNEIKKEIKNTSIGLSLNNDEVYIYENYKNTSLTFKKNLDNFFRLILLMISNKKIKNNEKNLKILKKFKENLNLTSIQNMEENTNDFKDFTISLINFVKENTNNDFKKFSIANLQIVDPENLTLSFEKEEEYDFIEFKEKINHLVSDLENSKENLETHFYRFFDIYSKLDLFIISFKKLKEIHRKSLLMLESSDILQKKDILAFKKELWELSLQSQNLNDFNDLDNLRGKIDEEVYSFLEIFVNKEKAGEFETETTKFNTAKLKPVLIFKRTIGDSQYIVEVQDEYTIVSFLNYKSDLKDKIFHEIDLWFSFIKRINEAYGQRILKNIKIGSKNLKITKKTLISYEEFFHNSKTVKITFINK